MIWIILCIMICGGIIATAAIISSKLIKKIKKQYNEHFELSKDLEKLKNEISERDKEKEQLCISKFKLITEVNDLNERKGILESIESNAEYTKITYLVPTRGIIGYRSQFINTTKGQGVMVKSFYSYMPYAGKIQGRKNGVLVSMENGKTMGFSLWTLEDRGTLIVKPATEVYIGMIIGINNRSEDLNVNPCKNKQLTNTRAAGSDHTVVLKRPRPISLEYALDCINFDELVEVTPNSIRLRKKK